MTNRRGFILSLLALAPASLVAKQEQTPEAMRFRVTINADDPKFKKAVIDAVLENYNNAGAIRTREIIKGA